VSAAPASCGWRAGRSTAATCSKEARCAEDWVYGFREALRPHTESAFLHFPDRDLAPDRLDLLRFCYAQTLEKLIRIKAGYDPENRFDFEMGIPTR